LSANHTRPHRGSIYHLAGELGRKAPRDRNRAPLFEIPTYAIFDLRSFARKIYAPIVLQRTYFLRFFFSPPTSKQALMTHHQQQGAASPSAFYVSAIASPCTIRLAVVAHSNCHNRRPIRRHLKEYPSGRARLLECLLDESSRKADESGLLAQRIVVLFQPVVTSIAAARSGSAEPGR